MKTGAATALATPSRVGAGPVRPDERPEARLLRACARSRMDAATAARIRALLAQEVDWVYVIRTGLCRGVLPLLHRSLTAVSPAAVPGATLEQLRRFTDANARRNAFLVGELLDLIDRLAAGGVRVVPFKGPVVAAWAYGDVTLRQFSDLDLLVRVGEAARARDLLLAAGYVERGGGSGVRGRGALPSSQVYEFVREDGAAAVELHWGITRWHYTSPIELDGLWERLAPVVLGGETILSLAPEDMLLTACVHGAKHRWERLDWVCDVAEMIAAWPQMDWPALFRRGRRRGSRRTLLLGFELARGLLDASLPDWVSAEANADLTVGELTARVRERLFRDPGPRAADGESGPLTRQRALLRKVGFDLRARERLRDRLRYLRHLVYLALVTDVDARALLVPGRGAFARLRGFLELHHRPPAGA